MIRIGHRDRLAPRRCAPTLILPRLEFDASLYVGNLVVEARVTRIVVTITERPLERCQRLVEATLLQLRIAVVFGRTNHLGCRPHSPETMAP